MFYIRRGWNFASHKKLTEGLVVVRPGEKRQRIKSPFSRYKQGETRGRNSRCQQLWRKRYLHQACKIVWRHRKGQYFSDHLPWGPVLYQVTDPQIKIARTTFSCTQVCLFVVVCWRSLAGMTKMYRIGTKIRAVGIVCSKEGEADGKCESSILRYNVSEN